MDNRSNILSCALTLFAARGYDAIGVQEIVQAAGVTKPTLYHYFGSKRGVLESLVRERFAPLLAQIEQATTYTGDLPLNLQRVVETYFRFAIREPVLYRLHLALWFAPPGNEAFNVIADLNARQQSLLEDLFHNATADHGNMHGRQQTYAVTLLGMINTYVILALNGYIELDETVVQRAVHQFSHGIYS